MLESENRGNYPVHRKCLNKSKGTNTVDKTSFSNKISSLSMRVLTL